MKPFFFLFLLSLSCFVLGDEFEEEMKNAFPAPLAFDTDSENAQILFEPLFQRAEFNEQIDTKVHHLREYAHQDKNGRFHHLKVNFKTHDKLRQLDHNPSVLSIHCSDGEVTVKSDDSDFLSTLQQGDLLYFGQKWDSECESYHRGKKTKHSLLEIVDTPVIEGMSFHAHYESKTPEQLYENLEVSSYSEGFIPTYGLAKSHQADHPHEIFRKEHLPEDAYNLLKQWRKEQGADKDLEEESEDENEGDQEEGLGKRGFFEKAERVAGKFMTKFASKVRKCWQKFKSVCRRRPVENEDPVTGLKPGERDMEIQAPEDKKISVNAFSFDIDTGSDKNVQNWDFKDPHPEITKFIDPNGQGGNYEVKFNKKDTGPFSQIEGGLIFSFPWHFTFKVVKGKATYFLFSFGGGVSVFTRAQFGHPMQKELWSKTLLDFSKWLPNIKIPVGHTGVTIELEPVVAINVKVEGEITVTSDPFSATLKGPSFQFKMEWKQGHPFTKDFKTALAPKVQLIPPRNIRLTGVAIIFTLEPEIGLNIGVGTLIPFTAGVIGGPRLSLPISARFEWLRDATAQECQYGVEGAVAFKAGLMLDLKISVWSIFSVELASATLWEPKEPLFRYCWKNGAPTFFKEVNHQEVPADLTAAKEDLQRMECSFADPGAPQKDEPTYGNEWLDKDPDEGK